MEIELQTGDFCVATVVRVEGYGVYFEYREKEILVLVPELSWGPGFDPIKELKEGDQRRIKIIREVPERQILMGSVRRAAKRNPYLDLCDSPPGTTVTARIREVLGGMVALEIVGPTILATMQRNRLPETVERGALIEASLVSVDPEEGRAELDFVRVV